MSYEQIIKLVVMLITTLTSLFTIYTIIFTVIGIFSHKKYPKAKKEYNYGIVIAARNEEKVIKNLLESIYAQDYSEDKIKVFVVADNCTDNTAQIIRDLINDGHTNTYLYEHNNPDERTKGYALRYLFEKMKEDGLKEGIDGYFVFDADNILNVDYISKMNDAFDYYDGKNAITSFRNSKNFKTNAISGCYGVWFYRGCRLEMRGRTVCDCSTRVSGTGYLATAEMLEDGWPYVTLTEDWEFSADQVLLGRKIMHCDDAIFYDEQPTNFKVMWRQRVRWARGHLLVCLTKYVPLFKSLFKRNDSFTNKLSKYDIMWRITPVQIINLSLTILQYLLLTLLAIGGTGFGDVVLSYLRLTGINLLKSYAGMFIICVCVLILEHKRHKVVSGGWWKDVAVCLFWPIFDWLGKPIAVVALFSKNLQWKAIPHKDSTTIEEINTKIIPVEENVQVVNSLETKESEIENKDSINV